MNKKEKAKQCSCTEREKGEQRLAADEEQELLQRVPKPMAVHSEEGDQHRNGR